MLPSHFLLIFFLIREQNVANDTTAAKKCPFLTIPIKSKIIKEASKACQEDFILEQTVMYDVTVTYI